MADFWDQIGSDLSALMPVLETVAPTVATAIGGPFAGMAVQALSVALLGKPDGTPTEIAAAAPAATAEQVAALRKVETDFLAKMEELGIQREHLAIEDRDSARQREVKSGDSWTPRVLAFLIIGGAMGTVAAVLGGYSHVDSVLAGTIIGYVISEARQVTGYYFGSSAGSAAKTDQMVAMAQRGAA